MAGFQICHCAMPRPIHATIHTRALRHNLECARRAAPDARVWAVVKANAYGHGIERVYEGLRAADGFALLDLAEAQRLRDLDWRGPILLLEGAFEARDLELCSRLSLTHVIHSEEQIDWLAAHKTQMPHRVFLKLNSGMNRLGLAPHALRSAWARLNAMPQVEEVTLMTHFSDADAPGGVEAQLQAFEQITQDLPGERSVANSAAILNHGSRAQLRRDWVRAGIMLYGSAPDYPQRGIADWALEPAMTLTSRLIAIQHVQAGDNVGYGSSYTAQSAITIGIVACGYADGYPRHCGSGTPVLVDGIRTQTVGRVSMDMLAVDLQPVLRAKGGTDVGCEVTLWGRAACNNAILPIDEVAHAGGTIGYEPMCALAQRVPVQVAD